MKKATAALLPSPSLRKKKKEKKKKKTKKKRKKKEKLQRCAVHQMQTQLHQMQDKLDPVLCITTFISMS